MIFNIQDLVLLFYILGLKEKLLFFSSLPNAFLSWYSEVNEHVWESLDSSMWEPSVKVLQNKILPRFEEEKFHRLHTGLDSVLPIIHFHCEPQNVTLFGVFADVVKLK